MFQRGINPDAVKKVITNGEIIAEYPDDQPFPSVLLLGFYGNQPVHIVVASEPATSHCYVITVYQPDPTLWDETFKIRRKP